MNTLYDIFLKNIIDKVPIEKRETSYSINVKLAEDELLKFLTTDEAKSALQSFKNALIEHMLMIREEDCERVLTIALTFERLIADKMEEVNCED